MWGDVVYISGNLAVDSWDVITIGIYSDHIRWYACGVRAYSALVCADIHLCSRNLTTYSWYVIYISSDFAIDSRDIGGVSSYTNFIRWDFVTKDWYGACVRCNSASLCIHGRDAVRVIGYVACICGDVSWVHCYVVFVIVDVFAIY